MQVIAVAIAKRRNAVMARDTRSLFIIQSIGWARRQGPADIRSCNIGIPYFPVPICCVMRSSHSDGYAFSRRYMDVPYADTCRSIVSAKPCSWTLAARRIARYLRDTTRAGAMRNCAG